jgi:hypothetical protein
MSAFLGEINPAICVALIRSLPSELRHARLVKREAFFAPRKRQISATIAIFEQTVANYGERRTRTGRQLKATERKKL